MITVPKQLYVGLNQRDDSDVPLGFATPFGTDKAFDKRKDTVDRWSVPKSTWNRETKAYVSPPQLDPMTIDNAPTRGFQISKSVRRTGWNGGNVVWRLEDPRGFELEISSANFAAIINHCNMDKGLIDAKCVWGREGAQNVLLPEGSEPYNEAFKATARAAKRMKKGEYKPGDIVELKDGRHVRYVGEVNVLHLETVGNRDRWRSTTAYKFGVRKRVVIQTQLTDDHKQSWRYTSNGINTGDNIFEFAGSVSVSNVIKSSPDARSAEEIAQEVHDWIYNHRLFDVEGQIVAIRSVTKDVPTYRLVPATYDDIMLNQSDMAKRLYGFYETGTDFTTLLAYESTTSYGHAHGKPATTNIAEGTWQVQTSSHVGSTSTQGLHDRKWHKVVATWGGQEYDLHYV